MGMNIWSTAPFFMVIYLAALQDIPESLYEAADIDGASAIQEISLFNGSAITACDFICSHYGIHRDVSIF